jgi:hypothetical protein
VKEQASSLCIIERKHRTAGPKRPIPSDGVSSSAGVNVRLRGASDADRDFFFAVRRAAFRSYVEELWGWDEAQQRRWSDRDFQELPIQIIESHGEGIGYLCVLHEADHDYLDELALLPEARGWTTRGFEWSGPDKAKPEAPAGIFASPATDKAR